MHHGYERKFNYILLLAIMQGTKYIYEIINFIDFFFFFSLIYIQSLGIMQMRKRIIAVYTYLLDHEYL